MTPQLYERHQDYVMSIGDLAPGQLLQGIPLPLDPDAPFVLRSKAIRCQYDTNRHVISSYIANAPWPHDWDLAAGDDVFFDLQVVDFAGSGTITIQCFLEGVKRGRG